MTTPMPSTGKLVFVFTKPHQCIKLKTVKKTTLNLDCRDESLGKPGGIEKKAK